VDILSGILFAYIKEYPQLTVELLNQLLVRSDFQPFSLQNLQTQTESTAAAAAAATAPTVLLSKEQKSAFIGAINR
jgi:hypothetical protein